MRKPTQQQIVNFVLIASALGISFVCPNTARFVMKGLKKYLESKDSNWKSQRIETTTLSKAIYSLKKRKLISIKRTGEMVAIILTEKGKDKKLEYDLKNLKIKKTTTWDGKWRMLMFDIPEGKKSYREIFRSRLKNLGFLQFQKSVWIYPFPCKDEIDFLSEHYRLGEYTNFLTIQIDNDLPLRKHFSL